MRRFGEFLVESGIAGGFCLIAAAFAFVAACYAVCMIWFGTFWLLMHTMGQSDPNKAGSLQVIVAAIGAVVIDILAAYGLWLLATRSER